MTRTDTASAVIAADPDRAFAALLDEMALLAWLPPADMIGRFEQFDMRPGGSYRLVLTYRDSGRIDGKTSPGTDVAEVRIIDIVPGQRLVQAVSFDSDDPRYSGTMTMTWLVSAVADGTRIDLEAEDAPPGITAEDHATGMNSSLTNLKAYLERNRADDYRSGDDRMG